VLRGPRKPLLALEVGEYVDSGENMRFSLKNVRTDIRSRDWTYDSS
jgi:hypothetical protein